MKLRTGSLMFLMGALLCMTAVWWLAGDAAAKAWQEHLESWHKRVSGAR